MIPSGIVSETNATTKRQCDRSKLGPGSASPLGRRRINPARIATTPRANRRYPNLGPEPVRIVYDASGSVGLLFLPSKALNSTGPLVTQVMNGKAIKVAPQIIVAVENIWRVLSTRGLIPLLGLGAPKVRGHRSRGSCETVK